MHGLLGFDPSGMSDEELLAKTTELHARLVWASRFGGSDLVAGLQHYLGAIEFERQERSLKMIQKQRDAVMPSVIETDPDLAAIGREAEQPDNKGKIMPQHKPRVTITRTPRTNRPVESSGDEPLLVAQAPKDKE
jgi:hypothetical protein